MDRSELRLGLRENWQQFLLLVLMNAFVGAMVGLERTLLPLLAEKEFGISSSTAALSFIAGFGSVKAIANLYAGGWAERWGRKPVLVLGWLAGFPVPWVIAWAPSWDWIVVANLLLGLNQGLAWSMTVVMKVDLAGPKRRGLALGLNEFAGYLSVAFVAWFSGYLASIYGPRPLPFVVGGIIALVGLLLSGFVVRETKDYLALERGGNPELAVCGEGVWTGLWCNTVQRYGLVRLHQAGFFNNLNDGVVWGLLPLLLAESNLSLSHTSIVVASYPATWGILQTVTGHLSDLYGRGPLITGGMMVQAIGLGIVASGSTFLPWLVANLFLGVGTAMVYPTLIAAINDQVSPGERTGAIGAYRFWRDAGYVAGALGGGALADLIGLRGAFWVVACLTALSGAASRKKRF